MSRSIFFVIRCPYSILCFCSFFCLSSLICSSRSFSAFSSWILNQFARDLALTSTFLSILLSSTTSCLLLSSRSISKVSISFSTFCNSSYYLIFFWFVGIIHLGSSRSVAWFRLPNKSKGRDHVRTLLSRPAVITPLQS